MRATQNPPNARPGLRGIIKDAAVDRFERGGPAARRASLRSGMRSTFGPAYHEGKRGVFTVSKRWGLSPIRMLDALGDGVAALSPTFEALL